MTTKDIEGGKLRAVSRNLKILCLLKKDERWTFDDQSSSFKTIKAYPNRPPKPMPVCYVLPRLHLTGMAD